MDKHIINPDYLFEVSWEVCNKVGGIYTVVATKALHLKAQLGRHHILIGPDVWMHRASNPDFIEDPLLFRSWRQQAASEGLRLRVGKWNIPGTPVAVLVDYKTFLPQSDEILTDFWDAFGVDSLTGNWDYKEAAVFGYVAGKVIESFYNYNLSSADKAVAQFHEWQTGAGLLQVKRSRIPVATVFTTHATVVGRCLAGNNLHLYDDMATFDGDGMARRFNVTALHSLEKMAAQQADIFTTVSEITAVECKQFLGRACDVVTPNGFENSITPAAEAYDDCRKAARRKLLEVASAMAGESFAPDSVLVSISGRYEYSNKGIDVFLDALGKIDAGRYDGRRILAFVMVPSGNNGPDKELLARLSGNGSSYTTQTSHYLMDD